MSDQNTNVNSKPPRPYKKLPSEMEAWQFNFASYLWTCQAFKIINWIVVVIIGIVVTYYLFRLHGEADSLPDAQAIRLRIVAGIVGTWIFVVLELLMTRMVCDWCLITSKAAQLYVEKCEQE